MLALWLALLYTNTAIVHTAGGFQSRWVVKPLHGIYPYYKTVFNEDRLLDPADLPWHTTGDYILLLQGDTEGDRPPWLVLYAWGYRYLLPASWLYLLSVLLKLKFFSPQPSHDRY